MFSSNNRFHRRGSTLKERADFGKLLQGNIAQKWENQTVFVTIVVTRAKVYFKKTGINYKRGCKKKSREVCTLSKSSLSRVIQGGEYENRYRNFGESDMPVDLLWITVTFVLNGILSLGWPLENWLHQEIPINLASDKGIAWIEEVLPSILETLLGCPLPVAETITQTEVPATETEEVDTGPLQEIAQSSVDQVSQQNTDEFYRMTGVMLSLGRRRRERVCCPVRLRWKK